MSKTIQMSHEELEEQVRAILEPEPDEDGIYNPLPPHPRLQEHHHLDTSYYKSWWAMDGDRSYEHVVDNPDDPLFEIIQSISVPPALLTSALSLFGESLIAYHGKERRWGVYRYYPSILMTMWAAFESWVRITSETLVKVVPPLPATIADALLEVKPVVERSGRVIRRTDRRSVLDRYWLLLKYGCNLEFDRGSRVWQAGEGVAATRDSLVHYHIAEAPTLTASEIWKHMEALLLLFIGPSTQSRRTLFPHQYDYHWMLVELRKFVVDFEERPLHKGWSRGPTIFYCPFDGVDDTRYPNYPKR